MTHKKNLLISLLVLSFLTPAFQLFPDTPATETTDTETTDTETDNEDFDEEDDDTDITPEDATADPSPTPSTPPTPTTITATPLTLPTTIAQQNQTTTTTITATPLTQPTTIAQQNQTTTVATVPRIHDGRLTPTPAEIILMQNTYNAMQACTQRRAQVKKNRPLSPMQRKSIKAFFAKTTTRGGVILNIFDFGTDTGKGNTLLHIAARDGFPWIIKLIRKQRVAFYGKLLSAKNNAGHTPFDLAQANKRTGIANFLKGIVTPKKKSPSGQKKKSPSGQHTPHTIKRPHSKAAVATPTIISATTASPAAAITNPIPTATTTITTATPATTTQPTQQKP